MLSDHIIQKLKQLYAAEPQYRPNSSIAEQLTDKTLIMFVGATCEGKNTIMEAVAAQNTLFKVAGTFTSREPRPSDDRSRYTYYQNTDEGLGGILQMIDNHEVVQYAVNPHAQQLYGSVPSDYRADYNLADVFSSAVETFRHLGFKRAITATIITDPAVWIRRFEERFPRTHPYRKARRDAAIPDHSLPFTATDHVDRHRPGDWIRFK